MRKIFILCCVFLYSCASTTQSHLDNVQRHFANADFNISETDATKDSNLDLLIDGVAFFHANEFEQSDLFFEEFNKRNLHETSSSITRVYAYGSYHGSR